MIETLLKGKSNEDIINNLSKLSNYELNNKLLDAAVYGLTFTIQYLIDAGANVNYKDNNGWTPLMWASRNGHKDTVELLKNKILNHKIMEEVLIYSHGILSCSVCVDNSLSIKKITKIVNELNPTNISSKWKLSKDKNFKSGESNPCKCDKFPESRTHYLFHC